MADQVSKADTLGVGAVDSSLVGDIGGWMKVLPPAYDQKEKKEEGVVGKVCLVEDGGGLNKLGDNSSQTHSNQGRVTELKVSEDDISLVELQGSPSSAAAVVQDTGSELMSEKSSLTSGSEVRERNSGEKEKVLENGEHLSAKVDDDHHDLPVKNGSVGDEEDKKVGNQEEENHEFSVGDFVWGKITNQPWWPGQIYNPSDASECAAKYQPKRNTVLLVAYFGDRSYAWCYPYQLKPFQEKNFEEMLIQSKSRKFIDAVEEAVEEIGRIVESEMICSCLQMETQVGLVKPLAMNPGIKEGIAIPNCAIDELLVTHFQPAKFLEILRYIAQVVSPTSMLELTVFQKLLLALNRSRGCVQLPMNQLIPEDSAGKRKVKNSDFNAETGDLDSGSPEEDWLSSPRSCGFGKKSKGKWPGISVDKLFQSKKQRTMVDILADDVDVEPKKCESDVSEEVSVGKKMSASRKTKKKKNEVETKSYLSDQDYLGSGNSVSPFNKRKKKKKDELSKLPSEMAEKEETDSINADFRGREENISRSLSRERKKSKYLSPPYTNFSEGDKSWIYPESFREGEIMRRANNQLSRSPPIVKCSGKTLTEKSPEESLGYPTMLEEKRIDFKLSSEEMFYEILAAALDSTHLKGNRSSRSVKGFFTTYRSSQYLAGSNYKRFEDFMVNQCDEKIEFSENSPCSLGKTAHETDHPTSNDKSEAKRTKGEEGEKKMLQSSKSEPKRIKRKDDKMPQDPKSEPKRRKKKDEKMSHEPKSETERVEKKDEKMLQDPKSEPTRIKTKYENKVEGFL